MKRLKKKKSIKNNRVMTNSRAMTMQSSYQKPRKSSDILAREYELTKGYVERLKQEFEKYKQLYLDEKDLVSHRERILEAAKRKEIESKQGVVLAEQELFKEKKRLTEIYMAVEQVRDSIKKESEDMLRIKNEIKTVIEDEKNVSESYMRFEEARRVLENAKYKYDTAQKMSDETLRKLLKEEGFENITKAEIDIAKEIMTKPLEEVKHEMDFGIHPSAQKQYSMPSLPIVEKQKPQKNTLIDNEDVNYDKESLNHQEVLQSEKVPEDLSLKLPMDDYNEALNSNIQSGNEIPDTLDKINIDDNIQKSELVDYFEGTKKEGIFSRLKKKIVGDKKKERIGSELKELEEEFEKIKER